MNKILQKNVSMAVSMDQSKVLIYYDCEEDFFRDNFFHDNPDCLIYKIILQTSSLLEMGIMFDNTQDCYYILSYNKTSLEISTNRAQKINLEHVVIAQ